MASTLVGSMAVGSMAMAVMAIHITTIKLVACPADRRRLNREACCRSVAVEEDSTAVAGNTAMAAMTIRITTIMLEAHRSDRRRACIVKEEGALLAITGTMECKDFVKAQGRQRSTGEGRGEGRIMATEVDALPMDTLAMVTRLLHQNNQ